VTSEPAGQQQWPDALAAIKEELDRRNTGATNSSVSGGVTGVGWGADRRGPAADRS